MEFFLQLMIVVVIMLSIATGAMAALKTDTENKMKQPKKVQEEGELSTDFLRSLEVLIDDKDFQLGIMRVVSSKPVAAPTYNPTDPNSPRRLERYLVGVQLATSVMLHKNRGS